MKVRTRIIPILWTEDDPDDRLLALDAFRGARASGDLRFVEDGNELLDYLNRRGRYAAASAAPRPSLIVLDLNLPRLDGREALREIKSDPAHRDIPVIVLSTSRSEDDILASYRLGVSSYLVKPTSYDEMVKLMEALGSYWCDWVELPR
jgi:two-component system response regulator